MPGNHSVCKVHAVFLFLEAKETVEVTEAIDVIMSVEVIEATEFFRTNKIIKITLIMFYKQHCKKKISLSFSKFHSCCLSSEF